MNKVLVIGLDGASFKVLGQAFKLGYAQHLHELVRKGFRRKLKAPLPAESPVSWPVIFTGLNPGKTGLFGWHDYSNPFRIRLETSRKIVGKAIWDILSAYGLKSIVVNVPMTYPPYRINGIMISGFPCPTNSLVAFPPSEEKKLRKYFPEYKIEPTKITVEYSKIDEGLLLKEAINLTKILEEKKLKLFDSYTKETPDVLLIHARFMYKHRKKVEEKIDELKVKPHILVTTQVCEVSLDISYDVMFTEIAPISDLIQRFGRVNRYKLKTDEVNVFVYKSKVHPYDDEELEEARKILEEIEELKTERQLIEKLDEVINKNSLYRKLKDASVELNIEKILRDKYFFLSLNVKEDLARGLLELRERITTLVIPNPYPDRCVFAGETEKDRIELANLLDRFSMCDNISERRKIFSEIKSFVVPIPRYWIDATKGFIKEKAGFPLISNLPGDRIYSHRYGFIPLR